MSYKQISQQIGRDIKVSFEVFPPAKKQARERLLKMVLQLETVDPAFVSITYGAGGSASDHSLSLIEDIKANTNLEIAAHLTCVGASRDEVDATVRKFWQVGINRFVALRGDPATGIGNPYEAHEEGYANGEQLVAGLKAFSNFDITVSAYPERHPESPDFQTDIDMLKRKIDNGATRAISQFCFDNDVFEAYLEKVRKAGIYIPIVPGILPIHHFGNVSGFAEKCGTAIPQWLADRFDGLDDDPATRDLVAAAVAAEQVSDLVSRGIREFHFYTMNKAELPLAICRLIGVKAMTQATYLAA